MRSIVPIFTFSGMLCGLENIQLQCPGQPIAIGRIGSSAVRDMTLQDFKRSAMHRASRIVEQQLLLLRSHLAEEMSWLLPVIIF